MGLASNLNLMNYPITIWTLNNSGNPYEQGWTKTFTTGQFVEKAKKTVSKTGEEVTSYAMFVLSERLDIKNTEYRLEKGQSLLTEPPIEAYEPISQQSAPTMEDIRNGTDASEWIVYV